MSEESDAAAEANEVIKYLALKYPSARPTGVLKVCPRCNRDGDVFTLPGTDMLLVVWHGERYRGGEGRDADIMPVKDLLTFEFGCGYDAVLLGYKPIPGLG